VSASAPPAGPLLHVENLIPLVAAPGARRPAPATPPVSFHLAVGERLAIVGAPEAGLSPLARAIALIDPPGGGRVRLGADDFTRAWGGRRRALRRRLQYVGSEGRRALPPFTAVSDILTEPLAVHRLGRPAERRAQAAAAAAAWQVNGWLLGARVAALSNALCQRVALARACLLEPRVLVCDRLTDRLEPAAAAPLLALLADYAARTGLALLLLTSDAALAVGFATRTLQLDASGLHEQ
jgi:peptide/nickel transport system ATP-binding protein